MPDLMDMVQDAQAADAEALQARARLPDATPPAARDCDYCGDPIASARLRAVPRTTHCLACEQLRERQAQHYRHRTA